jgi:hypothetical protein
MNQFAVRPVMVSGNGMARPSLFAGSVADGFGFHAPLLGDARLGQAPGQALYERAKVLVAQYDILVVRARSIANRQARETVLREYHGDPNDREGALFRRNTVAYNISEAEGYVPVNYDVFRRGDVVNRVPKLEAFDDDFEDDVKSAENTYGILPEPVVIERFVEVPGAPGAPAAFPIVPVLISGVAVAGLVLLLTR